MSNYLILYFGIYVQNKYTVIFDNGMEHKCTSNSMKILPKSSGFLPDDLESSESNSGGEGGPIKLVQR